LQREKRTVNCRGEGVAERSKAKSRKAKVLSSTVLFKGRVFTLRRDRVMEPSGIVATREVVAHPGSVVILPVFPDRRIVLIRQYRHAVGQSLWELVAGHKEPNESFRQGARRELLEETGFTAKRYTKLLDIYPSPGLLGEIMKIFLAEGLTKGAPRPEDDEKITTRIVTLTEAETWIRSGKIVDAKSVAGILYYSKFRTPKK
jgi:ADP-ribose pyrophosphatase